MNNNKKKKNKSYIFEVKKALLMGYNLGRKDESEGVYIDEEALVSFYLEEKVKL
ncbi:hypothetical protein [Pseudoalteromonas sp. OOF1S-7]|uniref:hypothetical protein n=1 Tax=Pseudoalteromonas sp. OOF1S-7 TaxID=2917757 RepID=UPI001EF6B456|nr:hypothetical protein [Pseudoalteromonas sp. OOF1S-7]MCG7534473.1 hypothetical protein [Pseudoalteromonas sp. OOF1S-7]